MSDDIDLLEEFLIKFANDAPASCLRQIKGLVAADFKQSNQYGLYKYEKKFLENLVKYSLGQIFFGEVIKAVTAAIRIAISADFTYENIRSHYYLVKRKLLKSSNAIFLYEVVQGPVELEVRKLISSGRFSFGYQGQYDSTIWLITSMLMNAYGRAYRTVAEDIVIQNDNKNGIDYAKIEKESQKGIKFTLNNDKFTYESPELPKKFEEISVDIKDELEYLEQNCNRIANAHPRLVRFIARYTIEFRKKDKQSINLFIYGGDIQTYLVRHKERMSAPRINDLSDPPIPDDIMDALDVLLLRHAIGVLSSPELAETIQLYENIRSLSLDQEGGSSSFAPFSKTVKKVSESTDLFDEKTIQTAASLTDVENKETLDGSQIAGSAAFSRGILAAFGKFMVELSKSIAIDAVKDQLTRAEIKDKISLFLAGMSPDLAIIVARFPSSLGWISSILRYFSKD